MQNLPTTASPGVGEEGQERGLSRILPDQKKQEESPQIALEVGLGFEEKVELFFNGAHLPLEDAPPAKAAEFWLKSGEADEALRELGKLPSRSWNHVWALKTRIAAMGGQGKERGSGEGAPC